MELTPPGDDFGRATPLVSLDTLGRPSLDPYIIRRLETEFEREISLVASRNRSYRTRHEVPLTHSFLTALTRATARVSTEFEGFEIVAELSNSEGLGSEESEFGLDFGVILEIKSRRSQKRTVRGIICQAKRHVYDARRCLPTGKVSELRRQCELMGMVTLTSAFAVIYIGETPWCVYETVDAVFKQCIPTLPFKSLAGLVSDLLVGEIGDAQIQSVDHACFSHASEVVRLAVEG